MVAPSKQLSVGLTMHRRDRYGIRLVLPLTDQYDYYHG